MIGCIEDQNILFVERLSTDATKTSFEYMLYLKSILELYDLSPKKLKGSILSSVVPPVTNLIHEAVSRITQKKVMVVGPGVKTGLNILMDNPAQVGSDLVINAVAAICEYQAPMIIISMGTATTLSIINGKQIYVGGMIIPGIGVSTDSLTTRTSKLPKISLDAPKKLIGTNTIDCMKSGVIHGNAAMIDGLITRIEEELSVTPTIIATGGYANAILPYCKHSIQFDELLSLKGLAYIYKKNQK